MPHPLGVDFYYLGQETGGRKLFHRIGDEKND
jgi:hypothetical protein